MQINIISIMNVVMSDIIVKLSDAMYRLLLYLVNCSVGLIWTMHDL